MTGVARHNVPSETEVLIIGAGAAGIEAALAARDIGLDAVVLEAEQIGASIRRWSHVRLFSPWSMIRSRRGVAALRAAGHEVPRDDALPTGAEVVAKYLQPLATAPALAGATYCGVRAVAATRNNTLKRDRVGEPERGDAKFRVLWEQNGHEGVVEARILIDATGVYRTAAATGNGGIPAPGERESEPWIDRYVPDVLGRDRPRFAGKRVLVVGCGHSAATIIADLTRLIREDPQTQVTWAIRSATAPPFNVIEDDALPARRQLCECANSIAVDPPAQLRIYRGVAVESFAVGKEGLCVVLRGERTSRLYVDRVVSLTGYRPDPSLLSELQVHHCYATDGLMKVSAALLNSVAASGDCLTNQPAPQNTLTNPEPGLFVIGSKSYGRFPHYLMRTGIQQVETVFGHVLNGQIGGPS